MPNPKVRTLTIGGVTYDLQDNISGYITGITSSDVTTALGFTPYNATNPNGYTSNTGTITKVQTTAGAHTTINVSSGAASFNVPTKTSHLTNDSGFLTSSDIASVMSYKGTKANYAALPSTGNTTGDVWHLTDTGAEWAWDGSAWQELGTAIDTSSFLTSESDPVFTASPAHGIAASDITNWNGKAAVSIVRW